ncbi:MAG: prolyl-tRNA synthetase [Chloroflexota bacterium]|jgi:prolyl-tRNA synthetase|nr:prolyl-tRNA synthetase [Chloroflexota bacterium]
MSTEAGATPDDEADDRPQPEYVEHITKKSEDFNQWYVDVVRKAELADYAPVRGCMVIRPYGFALWENIRDALDGMIKATGHQNMYFPLLIPESYLLREAEHVEGFAPEVAWVTRGGKADLDEPLAIRPTSEAIIGPLYKKWIRSHRDLPVLVNQWANVVRWEMRTRLFLRTTEFLWQEGHTFHETSEEAAAEVERMLDCYRVLAEDWCAMPVIRGRKTESEKFAGADYTLSIEALMSDGKALQAGTSHHLGQNFTRAYDITFADRDNQRRHPHGTSWGLSTRVIGGIIMAHGDEAGLILPPKVAPIQVVVIPIFRGPEQEATVRAAARDLKQAIEGGARVHVDERDEKPGYKYNDWELKGVPLRVEIGPRDIEAGTAVVVDRLTREKTQVPIGELPGRLPALLDAFHARLLDRALALREYFTVEVSSRADLDAAFDGRNALAHGPWCGDADCEAEIKDHTKGVTIRAIVEGEASTTGECAACGKPAKHTVYWARAY